MNSLALQLVSLIDISSAWTKLIPAVALSCKACLLGSLLCVGARIFVAFAFQKEQDVWKVVTPTFIYALIVVALFGNTASYSVLSGIVIGVYKGFGSFYSTELIEAQDQLRVMLSEISKSQLDAVSFFDPGAAAATACG